MTLPKLWSVLCLWFPVCDTDGDAIKHTYVCLIFLARSTDDCGGSPIHDTLLESCDVEESCTVDHDMALLGVDVSLCRAALAGKLTDMLRALALGANPNFQHAADSSKTPLIKAIESVR
jgi:hypothetical protein